MYSQPFLCHSFQLSSSVLLTTRSSNGPSISSAPESSKHSVNRRYSSHTHFFTDPSSPDVHDQTAPRPSFEQRMREQLKQRQQSASASMSKGSAIGKLVPDVRTLNSYKEILDQTGEDGKLMAVFWYSPWCKACKAALPGIRTLAKRHPDVQFIQVPVLTENANLHQGLDVPSVPYLHLYVPEAPRLVEELKMTRKRLSGFQKLLADYEKGSCSLELTVAMDGEDPENPKKIWSTSCPYSSPTRTSS
ncbi:unnamed protein product [Pseudo-nitzschia multistriata]|uniref:Thioredoxin domain-containing protein n=1 Tax=Pseudo-nitzschia multistriata TaxID=183589 RepID=A0A448Z394_9STRA|nr:unnamed protein product [Pseudo-nitzschia multistriata]